LDRKADLPDWLHCH